MVRIIGGNRHLRRIGALRPVILARGLLEVDLRVKRAFRFQIGRWRHSARSPRSTCWRIPPRGTSPATRPWPGCGSADLEQVILGTSSGKCALKYPKQAVFGL